MTESELLDQWWAPKPWKAKTKSMEFRDGGMFLYSMTGPDGTEVWSRANYSKIVSYASFAVDDFFCDEQGNPNPDAPRMHWENHFSVTETGTRVTVDITFEKEEDMETILKMGFEEGFTAAHGNLDELLATMDK